MSVRALTQADEAVLRGALARDPVSHVFVSGRVDAGALARGELLGYPAAAPRSFLHVGSNLVPVATEAAARHAFAERLPARTALSIVGPATEAMALWGTLAGRWGGSWSRARDVRPVQPVLVLDREPAVPSDPRVRPAQASDFGSYFLAAVEMYTEEVGVDPLEGGAWGYRRYVQGLVQAGNAFVIVHQGRVVFKTDVGNASQGVAQLQGVWIAPEFRGRGWAAGAVAAVCRLLLARYRVISLYVNDFNAPAIAAYRRAGFRPHNEFATVLY